MKPFVCLLLLSLSALGAESKTVFFSKSFPGSVPPYVSVLISSDGTAVYQEAPNDEDPVRFKLPPDDTDAVFALVDKLDRFKHPLESNLKVANMGEKTFRFESGPEKHEVKFNYSLDENAKLLQDWFERITETQLLHAILDRTVRYDRLGVNQSLLQIEAAWDRHRLVAIERFLPLLDRVIKNDSYMTMARERAAALADAIRNPKPKAAE